MKKALLVLFVLFGLFGSPVCAKDITSQSEMQSFARVVRLGGYACDECVRAVFHGKKHRGLEFRVICDQERNSFRVTLMPSDNFAVAPW